MLFTDGVEAALRERDDPIITEQGLFILAGAVHAAGQWNGALLQRMPARWDEQKARVMLGRLNGRGVLAPDADFFGQVWRLVGSSREGSAGEIVCLADPFCYLSHLSAMQCHQITTLRAGAIFASTPSRKLWSAARRAQIAALSGGASHTFALPPRVTFGETVRGRLVMLRETVHPSEPSVLVKEKVRVSPIGRTFVDMLAEPALCGGMAHVLAMWTDHARAHLDAVIAAVDEAEAKIVKVRAGYILSERLGIEDERVQAWTAFAQRGGSRKLDPEAPYAPVFSERWMLSLNVPGAA